MPKAFSKIISVGLSSIFAGTSLATASVIYQLPVRTYLATGTTRATAGTFDALTPEVLTGIKQLGADYLWVTGVMKHASPDNTDPDAVKGNAGSYYAIHDAWDVDPVLGTRADFAAAITRAHELGLKVMIDLVPNHTARTHRTDVAGKKDFGDGDRKTVFFDPANHYFYLPGQTFVPPAIKMEPATDGQFDTDPNTAGIQLENPARVTGNNVTAARPSRNDWYETAKLNYGFDFTTGQGHYQPRPRTWDMMVQIALHWLDIGVDGFRIDFAHSVPLEFWSYFSSSLRKSKQDVLLLAEVYENDYGMRVPGFSYQAFLATGIDSVYQSELYWTLHAQAQGKNCAQCLAPKNLPLLREEILSGGWALTNYVENHDEVRIASYHFVGGLSSAETRSMYGISLAAYAALLPGNFLLNGGQEVGEDGTLAGPFAGNNGKTSIFDFVFQPFVRKWLDHAPSVFQVKLRELYADLFNIRNLPAFAARHSKAEPSLIDLSGPNRNKFEAQWIASYLRYDATTKQSFVVVTNTDPHHPHDSTLHFTEADGLDSTGALRAMGISNGQNMHAKFTDVWGRKGWSPIDPALGNQPGVPGDVLYRSSGVPSGLYLGQVPAGTTLVLRVEADRLRACVPAP